MKTPSALLAVMSLLYTGPLCAGTGTYTDGNPDSIVLHVNFMYNETNTAGWQPVFNQASRLLFDATQKQIRISRVILYNNCTSALSRSDIRIFNDTEGASATVGGLGRGNTFIRLSQTHETATTGDINGNRGQFGLVHEMGHYVFALLDEYRDKPSEAMTPDAFCINDSGVAASIMDGGTTVNPENRRTEFCWSGNHRAGKTAQDKRRTIGGQSFENTDSWTFLAAYIADKHRATLTIPTTDPAKDPDGHGTDPELEVRSCGTELSIGIDSSESMSAPPEAQSEAGAPLARESRMDLVKRGVGNFLRLFDRTDDAAVVSVGSEVSIFPLAGMTEANEERAKSYVGRLEAKGKNDIGRVLSEAARQVGTQGENDEVIVLISDGWQGNGTSAEQVTSSLKSRGIVVHTLGLSSLNAADMMRLASETGGTYLFADTPARLESNFLTLLSTIQSQGIVELGEGRLDGNAVKAFPLLIDPYSASKGVEFLLAWNDHSKDMGMTLIKPNGEIVKSQDIQILEAGQGLRQYRVLQPEPGRWEVRVKNEAPSPTDFAFQTHSLATDVTLAGYAESDLVSGAEPLVIKAFLATHLPIGGANVKALVERPEGGTIEVRLFDNGSPEHGDDRANDGTYAAIVKDLPGPGNYTVDVIADTAGGYTVSPEAAGDQFIPKTVNRAVRKTRFSVVAQDIQPPSPPR